MPHEMRKGLHQPVKEMILHTRLTIPTSHSHLVNRSRLWTPLDVAVSGKVTLVSAPAGFGKTTLLTAWVRERNGRTAWFSLDEGDNNLVHFWRYLIAALQTVSAPIGRKITTGWPETAYLDWEMLITQLVNDLSKHAFGEHPITLVLDDYHLIHTNVIHQSLSFLLHHQPPQLHVVILSRTDPPLPLARLRVAGRLQELRAVDLRFTPAEMAEFFRHHLPFALSPTALKSLMERIEGWAAGMQLAALSLRGLSPAESDSFVDAFSGAQRYVLHYLMEEVLQQQPQRIQNFLLQTAVLPSLNPSLCTAVTGDEDAGAILRELADQNLFVLTLDESRQWYRYYRLFAGALRSRLEQTDPLAIPELHRRAMAWYADQDVHQVPVNVNTGMLEHLTERELEILTLIAHGLSNQQIADSLVIGVGTVKGHVTHLLGKLDAHNRTEAVAHARRLKLIKPTL
jgi:LuxR family transcriptional regulator, maltose regulon positive regulatory protein